MGKEAKGKVTTYLDFGKTQEGRRTSYDYYEGQDAYDLFMGSRYFKDIICYREGEVSKVYQVEDLRDQIRKYAALVACKDTNSNRLAYYEVGSSAMGVIDALEYLNKEHKKLNIKDIQFFGIDNSKWMNAAAKYTHEQYDISLFDNVRTNLKTDLFFAKGVSLMYAIKDEETMSAILRNSKISLFDYTFSLTGKKEDHVGTGLPVTYLDLNKCRELLESSGKVLITRPYVIKDYHHNPKEKTTLDCIYGDKEVIDRYIKYLEKKTGENLENYGSKKFIRQEI